MFAIQHFLTSLHNTLDESREIQFGAHQETHIIE